MTYNLKFHEKALAEYQALDGSLRERIKKKLAERLENPHVPKDHLSGSSNRYKIKIMNPCFRLVYAVEDREITVCVLAVGTRERGKVYQLADKRT